MIDQNLSRFEFYKRFDEIVVFTFQCHDEKLHGRWLISTLGIAEKCLGIDV